LSTTTDFLTTADAGKLYASDLAANSTFFNLGAGTHTIQDIVVPHPGSGSVRNKLIVSTPGVNSFGASAIFEIYNVTDATIVAQHDLSVDPSYNESICLQGKQDGITASKTYRFRVVATTGVTLNVNSRTNANSISYEVIK
jgi:hypothetical protein